jgi:ApbE superfamily uncharacterized protein (UPF0280 family)
MGADIKDNVCATQGRVDRCWSSGSADDPDCSSAVAGTRGDSTGFGPIDSQTSPNDVCATRPGLVLMKQGGIN